MLSHRNIKTLIAIAIIAVTSLALFEYVKQLLFSNLTLWESHLITISLGSTVIVVAAYLILFGREQIIAKQSLVEKHYGKLVESQGNLADLNETLEQRVQERTVELHQSENRFHHFIQYAPDAVYVLDLVGNILSANNQASVETGYTQDELLKLDIRDITVNLTGDREKHLQRLVTEGHSTNNRTHRRKDGSTFEVEVRASYSEFGDQKNVITLVRNITERNRTNETIRKLSSAVEQNPSMVVITDKEGTIEYVNPKFTAMSGFTAAEAIGQKPSLLKSGVTPRETYRELWETIHDGKEWHGEVLDMHKNGTFFWVSASINPIKNDAGEITHFVSMEEDITERKKFELEMREAQENAEIANRAKSEFLANMSHELRTPLNAIIGFSEVIKEETFGALANEKYLEYVTDIKSSGQHLLNLINEVLDVSTIEAGKIELHESEVQINKITDESIRMVSDRAKFEGVKIINSVANNTPAIQADELRMKQILVNLLSNAVKFTNVGGSVSVNAEIAKDNSILLLISDTGIGMDAKDLARAMEKFGQAERGNAMQSGGGTGLGLPLTKGLVEAHGGRLKVESEPNKGTTVTVRLPQERVIN